MAKSWGDARDMVCVCVVPSFSQCSRLEAKLDLLRPSHLVNSDVRDKGFLLVIGVERNWLF